jgi:hypothetical protein
VDFCLAGRLDKSAPTSGRACPGSKRIGSSETVKEADRGGDDRFREFVAPCVVLRLRVKACVEATQQEGSPEPEFGQGRKLLDE